MLMTSLLVHWLFIFTFPGCIEPVVLTLASVTRVLIWGPSDLWFGADAGLGGGMMGSSSIPMLSLGRFGSGLV